MLPENELLNSKMNEAYKQLRDELFCEETGLIYDSICGGNHELRFEHLPYAEEIQASVPNPHGYATGMEDSMLNAGFAIEMCICRAEVEPERKEECEDFARRLFRGMGCCATVHGQRGYVVRSVSPRDGHSYYMESSRDQFTLFVYGMWRYYHSSFSTSAEKNMVKTLLADIADYAESKMNDSADYNLGRLDGFPGVHLQMLNAQSHEAMRLPMFFAAAYDVTREPRFLSFYQKYYPQAMTESERMHERTRPWWHIELSQMQVSLALCRAVDPDNAHLTRFDELMKHIAKLAEKQTAEYHFPRMNDYHASWNPPVHAWRNSSQFTVQLFENRKIALRGGKVYLKGEESPEFKEAFDRIRAPGNMVTTMLLAPDYQPDRKFWDDFRNSVSAPEYLGHPSGCLVNILCAYYMAKRRKLLP